MKRYAALLFLLLTSVGCGNSDAPAAPGDHVQTSDASGSQASSKDIADARGAPGLAGRTEELMQPDHAALVFLYYDLAQIPPPIDAWIERDSRTSIARPADKAAVREQIRAELTAGMRSVQRIGWLRMSFAAQLSDYDPAYQEFTVRAFAPSSVFELRALGEKVRIKFRNAREAQTWQVTADEAQAIRDRLGYFSATADALLKIVDVQPGPDGGVILTDVIEYDVRSTHKGQLIGRVKVAR